jgi:hypothetical protein
VLPPTEASAVGAPTANTAIAAIYLFPFVESQGGPEEMTYKERLAAVGLTEAVLEPSLPLVRTSRSSTRGDLGIATESVEGTIRRHRAPLVLVVISMAG